MIEPGEYNSLYLYVKHTKNALYASRLWERTNGCDVTGDFIDLGFGFLGWKQAKIALKALMGYSRANKGRVYSLLGLLVADVEFLV
jgi:hypothetical protein